MLDAASTPYLGGHNGYQIPQARGNSRETAGYYSIALQDSTRTQPTVIATQVLTGEAHAVLSMIPRGVRQLSNQTMLMSAYIAVRQSWQPAFVAHTAMLSNFPAMSCCKAAHADMHVAALASISVLYAMQYSPQAPKGTTGKHALQAAPLQSWWRTDEHTLHTSGPAAPPPATPTWLARPTGLTSPTTWGQWEGLMARLLQILVITSYMEETPQMRCACEHIG